MIETILPDPDADIPKEEKADGTMQAPNQPSGERAGTQIASTPWTHIG